MACLMEMQTQWELLEGTESMADWMVVKLEDEDEAEGSTWMVECGRFPLTTNPKSKEKRTRFFSIIYVIFLLTLISYEEWQIDYFGQI